MYKYLINGLINYNDADTDSGNLNIEINEEIESELMNCDFVKNQFFKQNEVYDNLFTCAKTCDIKTHGNKNAKYVNNELFLEITYLYEFFSENEKIDILMSNNLEWYVVKYNNGEMQLQHQSSLSSILDCGVNKSDFGIKKIEQCWNSEALN